MVAESSSMGKGLTDKDHENAGVENGGVEALAALLPEG